uniref:Nucleotide-diphospho-sugar transferase domain-containing protein n=1 Tax=Chromera velia CCMP2878 TaxID=1169474 RepID=A0A0G4G259_9ALVE|eukprot:Cvel_19902.t1-p1 / transcript=Cvel_19902.t1 / gene=Cvel_19902 / organism=Chromera_velia_CCMP2878 / gene_product=hypothetical protein / transcript_product=hypothetical protein / location=Cvel_scaffold1748:20329-22879(+) / protein_length=528 / sequence_SO=supercontig / SO=protein_coding / is_pseudo=false
MSVGKSERERAADPKGLFEKKQQKKALGIILLFTFCISVFFLRLMTFRPALSGFPETPRVFAEADRLWGLKPPSRAEMDGPSTIAFCSRSTAHAEFRWLTASVYDLRRTFGSSVKVEIWSLTATEQNWTSTQLEVFKRLGITLKNVDEISGGTWETAVRGRLRSHGGFSCKIAAVYYTTSRHVMLMDPDSLLVQSPETFLDLPCYRKTGFVFFRDRPWLAKRDVCEFGRAVGEGRAGPLMLWDGESKEDLCDSSWWRFRSDSWTDSVQCASVVVIDRWRNAAMIRLLPHVLLMGQKSFSREGSAVDCNRDPNCSSLFGDKDAFWTSAVAVQALKRRCLGVSEGGESEKPQQRGETGTTAAEFSCFGPSEGGEVGEGQADKMRGIELAELERAQMPCFQPPQWAIRAYFQGEKVSWSHLFSARHAAWPSVMFSSTDRSEMRPLYLHQLQESTNWPRLPERLEKGEADIWLQWDSADGAHLCNFFGLDRKRGCLDPGVTRRWAPLIKERVQQVWKAEAEIVSMMTSPIQT